MKNYLFILLSFMILTGHFFICSTTPNTWANLGEKEKYFTKTGIFGIRLHFGAFELRKIE